MKAVNENSRKNFHKKSRKKCSRNRINPVLKSILFFMLVSAVGIFLSFTVFFKIEEIEVVGDTQYSNEQIKESCKINIGENLFMVDKNKSKESIERNLPYAEVLNIKKAVPNKVVIEIGQSCKYVSFQIDDKYIITNKNWRILEINSAPDESVATIEGVNLDAGDVGAFVSFQDKKLRADIENLLNLLSENDLRNIVKINLKNLDQIELNYDYRIDIMLGSFGKIDSKIKTAFEIITKRLGQKEEGILDLSMLTQGNRSYFRPKNAK